MSAPAGAGGDAREPTARPRPAGPGPAAPGADPAAWAGRQGPTSDAPLVAPGRRVRVSPSDVEALLLCPLRWFLTRVGGGGATSGACRGRCCGSWPGASPWATAWATPA